MKWVLALLLVLLPGLSAAEPFPALYDVTGVTANDVLNMRAEPTGSAMILAEFGPHAMDVEVVRLSDDQRWGLVNSGDFAGWVSMRYMARHPGQDWGVMPKNVYCRGTEPFWSFGVFDDDTARFDAPDIQRDYDISARVPGIAFPGDFAVVAEGMDGRATAVISQGSCNDGMSNREFGMTVGLLLERFAPEVLYIGCCTLQP
jgi:uncharacterized membrane protein